VQERVAYGDLTHVLGHVSELELAGDVAYGVDVAGSSAAMGVDADAFWVASTPARGKSRQAISGMRPMAARMHRNRPRRGRFLSELELECPRARALAKEGGELGSSRGRISRLEPLTVTAEPRRGRLAPSRCRWVRRP